MKTTKSACLLLSALTALLMSSVLSANPIAVFVDPKQAPEQQIKEITHTMTGTLGWKTTKQANGKEQKTLQLTTLDKKEVDLLPKESVKKLSEYDKYIGKTVKVDAVIKLNSDKHGKPSKFIITNITELKAPAQPKP
jgi:hypothetical protein